MTTHNTEFFQRPLFFLQDGPAALGPTVWETTLEAFIREHCEGDPARAWFIRENKNVILEDAQEAEDEYTYPDGEVEPAIPAKDAIIGTRWEVRENDNSRMCRSRLIETFETEQEANEYHLNGLYWNFCNKSDNAPFHADTREECEAEVVELNKNI